MNLLASFTEFLLHCRHEKSLSEKTIKAYETDLKQFGACHVHINLVSEITKNEIREYLSFLANLKPKTIKRKIATLKAFFNYLEFEDEILINPFRKMRIKIKEPAVLCTIMDLSEVKKILIACYMRINEIQDSNRYSYSEALRNAIVIELLFATGARVSEIANLKIDNINLQNGGITIKGKGNKERIVQICNNESLTILREYFQHHKCLIEKEGWFLINRNNKKLTDQSIRIIVLKMSKLAGLKRRITPHVFRHTFGTLLLEKGVDIRYIQFLLGHSSINTTQIYTHVNKRHQRQILVSKHPRRELVMRGFSIRIKDN